jgi:hypothetical protein
MAQLQKMEKLVTLRAAARHLGIGLRPIYVARDRGELTIYQFGTPWCWVRLSEARAWLERHRRPPVRIVDAENTIR